MEKFYKLSHWCSRQKVLDSYLYIFIFFLTLPLFARQFSFFSTTFVHIFSQNCCSFSNWNKSFFLPPFCYPCCEPVLRCLKKQNIFVRQAKVIIIAYFINQHYVHESPIVVKKKTLRKLSETDQYKLFFLLRTKNENSAGKQVFLQWQF